MSNWRKVWEEHNGPIPKGMHIHHIIPRSEGGTDDIENLQLVTPEEHYDIHFERGDYGACALISDGIEREAPTIPVVQFDLDGYRVSRYDSIVEANRLNGFEHDNVTNCCKYRKKSYKGYQWFYESEVGDIDYIGPVERKVEHGGHNTSRKYHLDTISMRVFNSGRSAGLFMNPETKCGAGGQFSPEFKNRFIKITKEEYKILKQLENE